MAGASGASRRVQLELTLTEYELPPSFDMLLLGRRAPVGPEGLRRMLEAVAPDRYDVLHLPGGLLEAVAIRRTLLRLVSAEQLTELMQREFERISDDAGIVAARVATHLEVRVSMAVRPNGDGGGQAQK